MAAAASRRVEPGTDAVHREGPERRIRYGWVWLVFVAAMLVGAALVLNPRAGARALGLALILLPVLAFGVLQLAYYLKHRIA